MVTRAPDPADAAMDPTDPTVRARRLRGHPTERSPSSPRLERQITAVLERLDAMRARHMQDRSVPRRTASA